MSTVRVERVVLQDDVDAIAELDLDQPAVGDVWHGPMLELRGSIVGHQVAVQELEIMSDGRVLRRIPVDGQAGGTMEGQPDAPGLVRGRFRGLVGLLGMDGDFDLRLWARLEDGARRLVGRIGGRRAPVRLARPPGLRPILLTSLGRSGTTWLMNLLGAHPGIVVYRHYPYETKAAQFWLHVLHQLSELGAPPALDATGSDRFGAACNPFFSWELIQAAKSGEGFRLAEAAEFCVGNIDAWYGACARAQGKEGAQYFAEKCGPNRSPLLARELYPRAKEIFLVRDFRDMVMSILAFDAKRGFSGFGREEAEGSDTFIRRLGASARSLHRDWVSRSGSSHLVRYEDLVLRSHPTLESLLDYLELDASPSVVNRMASEAARESERYRQHRTTRSQDQSVGRWRREADPETRDLLERVFGEMLDGFGYSRGAESGVS